MPMTPEQFEAHPLWDTANRASGALAAVKFTDPTALVWVANLRDMVTHVLRLREIPSWRFDPSAQQSLNDINSYLSSLEGLLHQLAAGEDTGAGSIGTLSGTLDNCATSLSRCPIPIVTSGHLSGITAQVHEFRTTVSDALGRAQEEVGRLNTATDGSMTRLADLQADIDRAREQVNAQATRLDAALNSFGERFDTEAAAWEESAETRVTDWQTKAENAITKVTDDAATARSKERAAADAHITALDTMQQDGKRLLEAVARKTTSNQYAQYAKSQGFQATLWAIATVLLGVFGFKYIVDALAKIDTLDPAEAIVKGLASLAILGAAAYAGSESGGHRAEARDAKRIQLDLNALEPAIARMDDDAQAELREQILAATFNRPRQEHRAGLIHRSTSPVPQDLAAAVAEAVTKALKS